jgi:hypothetical protein
MHEQDIPADGQAQAEEKLKSIEGAFEGLSAAIENKDVPGIIANKRAILNQIGDVEQLMVKGFPYEWVLSNLNNPSQFGVNIISLDCSFSYFRVPAQYKSLPQLKVRIYVERKFLAWYFSSYPGDRLIHYRNWPQGRATVELTLKKADPSAKYFVDGTTYDEAKLTVVALNSACCA